ERRRRPSGSGDEPGKGRRHHAPDAEPGLELVSGVQPGRAHAGVLFHAQQAEGHLLHELEALAHDQAQQPARRVAALGSAASAARVRQALSSSAQTNTLESAIGIWALPTIL